MQYIHCTALFEFTDDDDDEDGNGGDDDDDDDDVLLLFNLQMIGNHYEVEKAQCRV